MSGFTPDMSVGLAIVFAFGLGLSYGFGPCLLRCMPMLAPALLAGDRPKGTILLPLIGGRVAVYVGYAILAALFGQWITQQIPPVLASGMLGAGCLLAGGILLLQSRKRTTGCQRACASTHAPINPLHMGTLSGGAVLQGIGLSLIPCAPFASVLLYCAAENNPVLGLIMGLSFGFGAAVLPTFLIGKVLIGISAGLKDGIGKWFRSVSVISASLLMLFGLQNLTQIFIPLS